MPGAVTASTGVCNPYIRVRQQLQRPRKAHGLIASNQQNFCFTAKQSGFSVDIGLCCLFLLPAPGRNFVHIVWIIPAVVLVMAFVATAIAFL
eukprot:7265347-Ditylum_brightwellii.AAC.1